MPLLNSRSPLPYFYHLLSILILLLVQNSAYCQIQDEDGIREVYILEEPTQTSSSTEQQGGFSSHIVALRPDYTFWRMVNVLKTMFDTRTAEKRRPSRELDYPESPSSQQRLPDLRARRLLLNFGRFRF